MKHLSALFLLLLLVSPVCAQTLKVSEQEQLLEHYQSQRYAEAAKLLQQIFGEDPQDLKALSMLAYANNMAGSLTQAEKYYFKLSQVDPKNVAVMFSLAGINARRGNEEKAKEYYKQVLDADSNNFRALKLIAAAVRKPEERLKYLSRANLINPVDADVAYDLAIELNKEKQLSQAYKVLDHAFQADTSNYLLLKAKLPICISLKKLAEAQQTGDKLLKSGDSSSYVLNSMAKLALENKDYKKGIGFFKILEQRDEQSESSLYYTAVCYQKLNDFANAKAYTKATIDFSISPNVSSYYAMLGYLQESTGSFKSAQSAYLKGLQFENNGSIYYNLGLLNDGKLNNKPAALRYYKQYLQSKPDGKQQHETIDYVKSRIKLLAN